MNKMKFFSYVLSGALTLGVVGAAADSAFAAAETTSKNTTVDQQTENVKSTLNTETKEKVQAIMDELKTNLSELGVALPNRGKHGRDMFADLDEETKAKAEKIIKQKKEGAIQKKKQKPSSQN
ncbi:MAG TPA: hypothetical protein VEY70_18895 [Metabacillus sp.]|nr:hypothetical protein [Metabacillus sp.]